MKAIKPPLHPPPLPGAARPLIISEQDMWPMPFIAWLGRITSYLNTEYSSDRDAVYIGLCAVYIVLCAVVIGRSNISACSLPFPLQGGELMY
jgi:hypothetical protein